MTYANPFDWRGTPETTRCRTPQQTRLHNGLVTPANQRGAINVVGQEQGRIDAAKLQLTRGASR
jgi:hypothetical protein